MQNTITQIVGGVAGEMNRANLLVVLKAIGDRLSTQTHTSAALRIKGGSASAIVQTNAVYAGVAKGTLIAKVTSTDMPALVGTVVNATFNVFAFFIDSASTVTVAMGIAGTTLAKVTFPAIPEGKAVIGYVSINPTGTGNFVGGTTALDDGTVVPNAVFVNTVGAFDPSIAL
jgi:hypothetical protein